MAEITVRVDGKVLSRVFSGERADQVAEYLKGEKSVFVIYDNHVEAYARSIADAVPETAGVYGIEATEENKTMDTVLGICSWLLEKGAGRDAMVLAVGGGITTDMAGFAASIYKRGVRFAFVPTTLLSQVDAAIGGKTGVNLESYKNMLGVIRQPDFTYECPEVLETLPYRDFVSGTAELLKTFIIENNQDAYARAVKLLSSIAAASDRKDAIRRNRAELLELISAAAAVKAGVVSRDQFENGERRKLNLGHTFAHAIEWEARKTGTDIAHGEAVAIGIVLAAKLSARMGWISAELAASIEADFRACGMPTESPFALQILAGAMGKDKKAEGGKVHFVLIAGIGDVRMEDLTVAQAMAYLE